MSEVQRILVEVLQIPQDSITAETTMQATEIWDSLKHMELIFRIEEHFGLTLEGDEIALMTSVSAIEQVLGNRGLSAT